MPEIRNPNRAGPLAPLAEGYASLLTYLPAWTERAACAEPPRDALPWVDGKGAKVTVRMLNVCGGCSVRSACLRAGFEVASANTGLGHYGGSPMSGIWGGSTEAERSAALKQVRRERGVTSRSRGPETVARAIELLEDTFEARLDRWQAKADPKPKKTRPAGVRVHEAYLSDPAGWVADARERMTRRSMTEVAAELSIEAATLRRRLARHPEPLEETG